jgi:hypothetical protein
METSWERQERTNYIMTDHAANLESTLSAPKRNEEPIKRWAPPAPAPAVTTPPKLNQICELLLELPHEQIKHMSREVLSDLETVSGKSVADVIESLLAFAHRELKQTSA